LRAESKLSRLPASEVLRRHEAELRQLPEVSGAGLGEEENGEEVIVVFARHGVENLDAVRALVPAELEGYRTQIRPEIRVFPGPEQEGDSENGD
jgi:hypothetical protein